MEKMMELVDNLIIEKATEQHLGNDQLPMLHIFIADWCGSCHIMEQMINDLARKYDGIIDVEIIDCGDEILQARELQYAKLPVFVISTQGVIAARMDGLLSSEKLDSQIELFLQLNENVSQAITV
jgi:thioredoxin 1